MSNLTKEMLKRCQNELKQAFCALDTDVQEAILENYKNAESLQHSNLEWYGRDIFTAGKIECYKASVWRLSPDTPTEPEWLEMPVVEGNKFGILGIVPPGAKSDDFLLGVVYLSSAISIKSFLGIIYTLNGVETLRTSVDAAFGTPVRVRFLK